MEFIHPEKKLFTLKNGLRSHTKVQMYPLNLPIFLVLDHLLNWLDIIFHSRTRQLKFDQNESDKCKGMWNSSRIHVQILTAI